MRGHRTERVRVVAAGACGHAGAPTSSYSLAARTESAQLESIFIRFSATFDFRNSDREKGRVRTGHDGGAEHVANDWPRNRRRLVRRAPPTPMMAGRRRRTGTGVPRTVSLAHMVPRLPVAHALSSLRESIPAPAHPPVPLFTPRPPDPPCPHVCVERGALVTPAHVHLPQAFMALLGHSRAGPSPPRRAGHQPAHVLVDVCRPCEGKPTSVLAPPPRDIRAAARRRREAAARRGLWAISSVYTASRPTHHLPVATGARVRRAPTLLRAQQFPPPVLPATLRLS